MSEIICLIFQEPHTESSQFYVDTYIVNIFFIINDN